MKPSKGYYCLIQYCPDLSRLEAANIGVLLFCPERLYLQARTARDNRRIKHFFGREGHDWSQINSFKSGIEERLEVEHRNIRSLNDLRQFIELRANQIQITAPRPMRIFDPDKDLGQLFQDLVGGMQTKDNRRSFESYVGQRLSEAGLRRQLVTDLTIRVPILNEDLKVPFGYQNGRFNLIRPETFEAKRSSYAITKACRFAVEGDSLHGMPHPEFGNLQLVIVGRFASKKENMSAGVRQVLREHHVQLYTEDRLPDLIDEIRRTGREIRCQNEET